MDGLRIEGRIALWFRPERIEVGGEMAVGAVGLEQRSCRLDRLKQLRARSFGDRRRCRANRGGKRRPTDTFVPKELIRRFKMRTGSMIGGTAFPPDGRFPNPKMRFIETVDGVALEDRRAKFEFTTLTTISPMP